MEEIRGVRLGVFDLFAVVGGAAVIDYTSWLFRARSDDIVF